MNVQPTDRELDLLNILWERGPSTVAQVQEALTAPLAYTTVLTLLRVMEEKGLVSRTAEGRAHRYAPAVERSQARTSALRRLTDRLFSGDPGLLVARLVEDEALTPEELDRLRALLDQRLGTEDRPPSRGQRPSPPEGPEVES